MYQKTSQSFFFHYIPAQLLGPMRMEHGSGKLCFAASGWARDDEQACWMVFWVRKSRDCKLGKESPKENSCFSHFFKGLILNSFFLFHESFLMASKDTWPHWLYLQEKNLPKYRLLSLFSFSLAILAELPINSQVFELSDKGNNFHFCFPQHERRQSLSNPRNLLSKIKKRRNHQFLWPFILLTKEKHITRYNLCFILQREVFATKLLRCYY